MEKMREKLAVLLGEAKCKAVDAELFEGASFVQQMEMEADHLIANGVTVQRRIPTTERIPTRADADPDHEKVMAYSIIHKAWKIEHFTWVASHPDWFSHWMPMPKPPKEVQK